MRVNLLTAVVALVITVVNSSTLTPPVLPLIVRNPYLSIWFPESRDVPWKNWPAFWTGSSVGFAIMASVPETESVYPLLGCPHDFLGDATSHDVAFPEYHGATFDASTTNLTYSIKGTDLKIILSFLSPITPTSTLRQSFPAGYLACYVEGSSDLSLYVDINGEWASGKRKSKLEWSFGQTKSDKTSSASLKSWRITRQDAELLSEFEDHAEWGTVHLTGPADVEHQSGEAKQVRRHFAKTGSLKNYVDDEFRGVFEEEPIFAFSKKFTLRQAGRGAVTKDSVLFTFALTQDPVAQFASARGLTLMRPLWGSYFSTAEEMLQYHYDDFKTATYLAGNYSLQLSRDAFASGSLDYQDIVSLSARQVLGGTVLSGTPDDPILFLKEISSDGNFQTVDVIYPAFPFFLYTNPKWLEYLLEPLIEHQLSGQYPNDYSMHDLGSSFPNATGHSDGRDEYMPVEECGNMLIMGLALLNAMRENSRPAFVQEISDEALASGLELLDSSSLADCYGIDHPTDNIGTTGEKEARRWATHSYQLWKKWTGYLVRESLIPSNQLCTDDFAGWLANQTNLALKGIVGIKAMSGIADLVGETKDAQYYGKIADDYISKWQDYGISRDKTHAKLAYTWYGSWTTIYNIYADALLCFHLPGNQGAAGSKTVFIPDDVYKMQSDWYHAVLQRYGLPLDSRHLYTKSDWEFFAAAVTSRDVRTEILQSVARWVNETTTDRPFTDLYETEGDGGWPGPHFMARPVIGGHFAFLALERACGGKATEGLAFLDNSSAATLDVEELLRADFAESVGPMVGEL